MEKRCFLFWSCLFLPYLGSSVASADVLPPPLFEDLGHFEFRVRENAENKLLEHARVRPDESIDELYRRTRVSKDPEVRERCLSLLRQLIFDQYMREGKGFVGIGRDNRIVVIPGKVMPCHVVAVTSVRPDTPADRAGIRVNDLIVTLNGIGWSDENASNVFADQIAAMNPGTKVALGVFRDGKLSDIDVILTRRPLSADIRFFEGQGSDSLEADRIAMEDYFREWLKKRRLDQ